MAVPLVGERPPGGTGPTQNARKKRHVTAGFSGDQCIRSFDGLELKYTLGTHTAYQFELCDMINCGGLPKAMWNGYDVYICDSPQGSPEVVQGNGPPSQGRTINRVKRLAGTIVPCSRETLGKECAPSPATLI